MKRFALILAAMVLSLPMTGCGDAGSDGSPPAAATPDEETSPAPKGKAAKIQRPAGPADGANPAGPKNDR